MDGNWWLSALLLVSSHQQLFPVAAVASNVSNSAAPVNVGGGGLQPRFTFYQTAFIATASGALSVWTVAGNAMVMVSFAVDPRLRSRCNYFLFSLALADVLVGLVSMPLHTVYTVLGRWPFGRHACDMWLALDYLASNASVLNLLMISFDRYWSVTKPLTYRASRTKGKVLLFIAAAWIISLGLWLPWIYLWPIIEGRRTVPETQCYIQFITTNQYVTFVTAIAAFYVPVTVMCCLYFRIYRETRQRQKDMVYLKAIDRPENDDRYDEWWDRIRSESNRTNSSDNRRAMSRFSWLRIVYSRCPLAMLRLAVFLSTTWSWLRNWCVDWWHSADDDDEGDDDQTLGGKQGDLSYDTMVSSKSSGLNAEHQGQPATPSSYRSHLTVDNNNQLTCSRSGVSDDTLHTVTIQVPAAAQDRDGGDAAAHAQQQAAAERRKKAAERKRARKVARTLSAILLTFIVTWTPYNVLVLLKPFNAAGGEWLPRGAWDFFYYLCYINSTLNPLCYALSNTTFRTTYVRLLKCKWNGRRRPSFLAETGRPAGQAARGAAGQ